MVICQKLYHSCCKHSYVFQNIPCSKPEVASLCKGTCKCMAVCAQIIPQKAKPLSSFTNEEGMKLLMGPNYQEAETKAFALADLDRSARLADAVIQATNLEFVQDLLKHLGVDLAVRCLHSEPRLHSREYAKRELISPLLYVASILAGKHLTLVHYSNLSY